MSYNSVNLTTATTGTRIVKTTVDGLGRTVRVETGDSNGTQSMVDTTYDSCACSPLGKVQSVSRPYAPGATPVWTTYTYDALGRTTRIDLPGATGAVTYAYVGNTTTVTDPAGKWKKYTSDALGNLIQVTEPAPEGGTHETYYTYNVLGQMTQVQMPRTINGTVVTQTRTFNYDLATGRLASAANPENGAVSYTYNADGTLLRKTDAKNQKIEFAYDSYQRVTQKHVFTSPTTEDPCGLVNYFYDTNSFTVTSYVEPGQLVAVQYGGLTCTGGRFTESFSHYAGLISGKTLMVERQLYGYLHLSTQQSVTFGHTPDGVLSSVGWGWFWSWGMTDPVYRYYGYTLKTTAGPGYSYSFDTLGRPIKMTLQGNPADSRWTWWKDGMDWVTNVTHGPAGELTQMKYPSSSYQGQDSDGNPVTLYHWYTKTQAYNTRGQLTRLKATGDSGSPPNVDLEYRYSPTANDGRITQMKNWIGGEEVNYQYDPLGRLTQAQTTGPEWGQNFAYDGFGNLASEVAIKGTAPTGYHPLQRPDQPAHGQRNQL